MYADFSKFTVLVQVIWTERLMGDKTQIDVLPLQEVHAEVERDLVFAHEGSGVVILLPFFGYVNIYVLYCYLSP